VPELLLFSILSAPTIFSDDTAGAGCSIPGAAAPDRAALFLFRETTGQWQVQLAAHQSPMILCL